MAVPIASWRVQDLQKYSLTLGVNITETKEKLFERHVRRLCNLFDFLNLNFYQQMCLKKVLCLTS